MQTIIVYLARFFLFNLHYKYLRFVYRFTVIMDHSFGLRIMVLNLFKPLYGFPGVWNRFIGAVFRLFALLVGTIFILGFLIISLSVYPLIAFGFYYLTLNYTLLVPVILIILVFLYLYRLLHFHIIPVKATVSNNALILSANKRARRIIRKLMKKNVQGLLEEIRASKRIKHFNTISELDKNIFDYIAKVAPKFEWKQIADQMRKLSEDLNLRYASLELVYVAILTTIENLEKELSKYDLDIEDIINSLAYLENLRKKDPNLWSDEYMLSPSGGIDKSWAVGYTEVLNRYGEDLTKMALKNEMPKLIGRKKSKDQFVSILRKPSRNNVMIIGGPGSGKTTFVKALAREIAVGTTEKALRYKRIIALNIGELTAGTQGEINDRLSKLVKEVNINKNIIIFVDEIHNLSSTLNVDPNAVAAFSTLEPHLSAGRFQFIGATSRRNYVRYIKPNQSFTKLFDLVELPDATEQETNEILQEEIKRLGVDMLPIITYPALKALVGYATRYIHTSVLPDSAVELMNEGIARVKGTKGKLADRTYINDFVSDKTGVPVSKINVIDKGVLENLEQVLHSRVIGQNHAISQIAKAIKRARTQVRDVDRPIASFLFAGPTGVGKTETAKALAMSYFGSEKNMIRFDMSEYQDPSSIKRLIGTQDAAVGLLTSAVREKPYSLILIDEIEKAHDNIQYLFLQVLDDGRLTDAVGNVIDFTNTFIIMTSNAGTREVLKVLAEGKTDKQVHDATLTSLKKHFAPEFLNRFTAIVPFSALTELEVKAIVKLKIERVKTRMLKKHMTITFSERVLAEVAKKGYSKEWGARELNRVIEDTIETLLAEKIISGELKNGDSLHIDKLP